LADSPDSPLTSTPPARPRLLPALRWARLALVLLLAFTLLRGAVWAMTYPSFYGGDEDYHYLYIEHLTTQHSLPSRDEPLYPEEYVLGTNAMNYNAYGFGPRTDFSGDPHATTRELEVTDEFREPIYEGRGVGVVHPPLYHLAGWAVNASLGDASFFTRYAAIKWMSSVFGVLLVYAAWLLAAQVFRREPLRLLVAFLVAVQPVIALSSGIANHDILLMATFTLACAQMCFMLRTAPRVRQGAWLGTAIVLALLTKGSALALIPLAGLVFLAQGLVHRERWRRAARSAGLAALVVFAGAGWWYLRSLIVYDSATGFTGLQGTGQHAPATLANLWDWAREWTGFTYRTYWFHHLFYEAPKGAIYYYVPLYAGFLGMLGVALAAVRRRRELLSAENPLLRQIVLLTAAALALYLGVMGTDIKHKIDGIGFNMVGGRYLLPAYAGVVTLLVVGLRELFRERAQPLVLAGLAALGGWFCWSVYGRNYLHRYYGPDDLGWQELFRRMSFDRPEFVTPTSLTVAMLLVFATLVAAVVCVAVGTRPPRRTALSARRAAPWRRRAPAKA
jgi:hypothetical protein